jgi:hypothetical protein
MTNVHIQRGKDVDGSFYTDVLIDIDFKDPTMGSSTREYFKTEAERDASYEKLKAEYGVKDAPDGVMTYSQRYAALELSDKLYQFAEQYGLPESWRDGMYSRAKLAAKKSKGINIDEA